MPSNWQEAVARVRDDIKALRLPIPRTPAQAADMYYEVRQRRYSAKKLVDALQAQETLLGNLFINVLPKDDATGVSGKVAHARVENKVTVHVASWEELQAYVARTRSKGGFALMQRRVNEAAVKEIWEAGKKVPGTEEYKVPVVRVTKL